MSKQKCAKGCGRDRYSSSGYCKECHAEYMQQYRSAHREHILSSKRDYMKTHRNLNTNVRLKEVVSEQSGHCLTCQRKRGLALYTDGNVLYALCNKCFYVISRVNPILPV